MLQKFLTDRIVEFFRDHQGIANAIPRRELRVYLARFFPGIGDRTVRRTYAKIEQVGYCSKGLYWITDNKDLAEYKGQQRSRAISIFARTKKSELALEDPKQGNLEL